MPLVFLVNNKCVLAGLGAFVFFLGCATGPRHPDRVVDLGGFVRRQEELSWRYLQVNISPTEPKAVGEGVPLKGVVVAALSKKDPDYYFHWVRDSAQVMNVVALAYSLQRPFVDREKVRRQFDDFIVLSRRLQETPTPWGLGEPRFTVEGKVDTSPWSRPQFDGPALRALATLNYLKVCEREGVAPNPLAARVLRTDLEFIEGNWSRRGFDIWEEYNAENYHTRLVQLAALEKGAAWGLSHRGLAAEVERYQAAARKMEALLDDHWDPARGFLRSQLAIVATDGYTTKKTDLDSAVILAVIEADRERLAHSVMDDRVQATVAVLEDLFRREYPINTRADVGLAYGRYLGDTYYGGNPWYLITSAYAEFYYRLADRLARGQGLVVTARNLGFLRASLSAQTVQSLKVGQTLESGSAAHRQAQLDFVHKGDLILERLALHVPEDGQLFEQFDKKTGRPTSSRGIAWSHAAFLAAVYERQQGLKFPLR